MHSPVNSNMWSHLNYFLHKIIFYNIPKLRYHMIHEKTVSCAIEREKLLDIQQCHGDVRNSDLYKIHMVGWSDAACPLPHAGFVPNNINWGSPLQISFLYLQTLLSHRLYPNLVNPMFTLLFSLAVETLCLAFSVSVSVCLEEIWSEPLLSCAHSLSSMLSIFSSERVFRISFPTRCMMEKVQFYDLPKKKWRFGGTFRLPIVGCVK